jgi:hypothetical protein
MHFLTMRKTELVSFFSGHLLNLHLMSTCPFSFILCAYVIITTARPPGIYNTSEKAFACIADAFIHF